MSVGCWVPRKMTVPNIPIPSQTTKIFFVTLFCWSTSRALTMVAGLPVRPSTPPGFPPPTATKKKPSLLSFGVVCSSNINRSMEAHVVLGNAGKHARLLLRAVEVAASHGSPCKTPGHLLHFTRTEWYASFACVDAHSPTFACPISLGPLFRVTCRKLRDWYHGAVSEHSPDGFPFCFYS
jgi:hypothetical protein